MGKIIECFRKMSIDTTNPLQYPQVFFKKIILKSTQSYKNIKQRMVLTFDWRHGYDQRNLNIKYGLRAKFFQFARFVQGYSF